MFTKYHDYPKECTEEFFELTRLIDCLEIAMIKGGFVKSQAFRQPAVQPDYYEKTQQPWIDRKVTNYMLKLQEEITS